MHLLLDYQKVWGVEGDKHMPLLPRHPCATSGVWVLLRYFQPAQCAASSPRPLTKHTTARLCPLEAGKQPGFGYWKWWFCRLLTHLIRWLVKESFLSGELKDCSWVRRQRQNSALLYWKASGSGKRILPPSLNCWYVIGDKIFETVLQLFPSKLWLKYK